MKHLRFKYRKENRPVDTLKLHPIVETIGFVEPDEVYKSELNYLGHYKEPVITENGMLLTLPECLIAALDMKLHSIDVRVIEGANEHAILRLINLDNRHIYRGSKTTLYKIIKLLQNHLWNDNDGRVWYNELPGDDINEKIGALVGYSPSTISNIKFIGEKNITYLEKVDDPDDKTNLAQAQVLVENERKLNNRKPNYSGVRIASSDGNAGGDDDSRPNPGKGDPQEDKTAKGDKGTEEKPPKKSKACKKPKPVIKDNLISFKVGFGDSGEYSLSDADGNLFMEHDGKSVGDVIIQDAEENNIDEELRFIILNTEGDWSFHVTATRLTNILKQKEV